jgi:hypothetical protein
MAPGAVVSVLASREMASDGRPITSLPPALGAADTIPASIKVIARGITTNALIFILISHTSYSKG